MKDSIRSLGVAAVMADRKTALLPCDICGKDRKGGRSGVVEAKRTLGEADAAALRADWANRLSLRCVCGVSRMADEDRAVIIAERASRAGLLRASCCNLAL